MDALSRIRELVSAIPKDAAKANRRPYLEQRMWRGRWQFCAGYSWNRPAAHPITGRTYDTILGAGATAEEAVEMMSTKVM